jgi:hypothetical protein
MTSTYYAGTTAKGWIYYYNREAGYGFAWIDGRTVRISLEAHCDADGDADDPILLTDQPCYQPPPWRPGIRAQVRILALLDASEDDPRAAAWCVIPAREHSEPGRVLSLTA